MKMNSNVFVNNGSAGMPNFSEFITGLVTRVAKTRHPKALYRAELKDKLYRACYAKIQQKKSF